MANFFESIPNRSNADVGKVNASWWNSIREKLIEFFAEYYGEEPIPQTKFSLLDNQFEFQNFAGLIFDSAKVRAFKLGYTAYRTNGVDDERREVGYISAGFKKESGTWTFSRRIDHGDDALGLSDSINVDSATAQIKYKSDEMGGGGYEGFFTVTSLVVFKSEDAA